MHFVDASFMRSYSTVCMSPTLSGNSVLQHIKLGVGLETHMTEYLSSIRDCYTYIAMVKGCCCCWSFHLWCWQFASLRRAKTILSGTIVQPDPQDPNSTQISILLQIDIKGWIPHNIANHFAAKAPGQWRDDLFNFYHKVYFKELAEQQTEEEGTDEGITFF